jgi:hypothetical protein
VHPNLVGAAGVQGAGDAGGQGRATDLRRLAEGGLDKVVGDRLAAAAMSGGALAAKLAGAGQGGTVLAVTFDKERTVKALLDAGATRILYPKPGPGLTITVDA